MPISLAAVLRIYHGWLTMGLYHPLDGVTNLKYKLLYFSTHNKKISKRKALAFNRDRCYHLVICLQLILFYFDSEKLAYKIPYIIVCNSFITRATGPRSDGVTFKHLKQTFYCNDKCCHNVKAANLQIPLERVRLSYALTCPLAVQTLSSVAFSLENVSCH
jgi:hypothetical protein